jgi:hypothetical protein
MLMLLLLLLLLQVASWGAYLLKRNIIVMSFAPRDTHEAQVQFALERGVPAIIGVMGKHRLPYPSRAFDMAHCSRCLIPWHDYGEHFMLLKLIPMCMLFQPFMLFLGTEQTNQLNAWFWIPFRWTIPC